MFTIVSFCLLTSPDVQEIELIFQAPEEEEDNKLVDAQGEKTTTTTKISTTVTVAGGMYNLHFTFFNKKIKLNWKTSQWLLQNFL